MKQLETEKRVEKNSKITVKTIILEDEEQRNWKSIPN